jgi:hypothetical protein
VSIAGHNTPTRHNRPGNAFTNTVRLVWRYVSGNHLDGTPRTNATAFKRGTRPLDPQGRITRWSCLSRAERAAYRWMATGGVAGASAGMATHPAGTQQALTGAMFVGCVAAGVATGREAALLLHVRNWLAPLHAVIERPLGLPRGTRPTSYLRIPRDYYTRTDVGRIELPIDWSGENRSAVTGIVKERLGLTDVDVKYHLKGRKPYAELKQTPRPRAKALFSQPDVKQLVLDAKESAPFIGYGPCETPVSVDLDSESPHILVSASTGGGKSVIARGMACQALHNGAQVLMLDRKRISHKWARGIPQVHYARDISEIHDAFMWLGEELERRTRIVDDWEGDETQAPVGPRLIIVVEEVNATVSRLKKYWTKAKGKGEDKDSPAIEAFGDTLFMGRAIKMHIIAVGQSITAQAIGGPEMRECFGTRILARYTRNAWGMLVPEVTPIPRSTRHVGRAQVVLGGVATETQVAFFSEAETREWATSGTVAPPLDLYGQDVTSHRHTPAPTLEDAPAASRDVTPRLTLVKGGPDATETAPPMPGYAPTVMRYTLAEASRYGVVPMKPDALRAAKKRDTAKGEFPAGENGRWTAEELQRWYRNRPNNKEAAAGE